MDWIVTPLISPLGSILGVLATFLLWAGATWLCSAIGRRRLQRRTEARLHEEGKRRLLRARDKVQAELRAEGRLQTNGASSSRATRPGAGTPPGRSTS